MVLYYTLYPQLVCGYTFRDKQTKGATMGGGNWPIILHAERLAELYAALIRLLRTPDDRAEFKVAFDEMEIEGTTHIIEVGADRATIHVGAFDHGSNVAHYLREHLTSHLQRLLDLDITEVSGLAADGSVVYVVAKKALQQPGHSAHAAK